MKIIIKISLSIIHFFGIILSFLFPKKIIERIKIVKVYFYSGWVSREFKNFGKGSLIFSLSSLHGGSYISIGDNCSIGQRAVLNAWDRYGKETFTPFISIGNNVIIGSESHITAINRISIANNVLTGKKITITDNSHGHSEFVDLFISPASRSLYSPGPVIIEEGVWIGDKVTILPNVCIGQNSIIGANAVVTKDIPANCVAAGIPAKIIKNMSI